MPFRVKKSHNYPNYFSKELVDLLHRKNRLYSIYKKSLSDQDYSNYSECRKIFKNQQSRCKKEHENRVEANMRENPKEFWSFLDSKKSAKSLPDKFMRDKFDHF